MCGIEQNIVYRLGHARVMYTLIPEYDIFRVHTDGTPIWLGPANTLDDAQARIRQLRATKPAD